MTVDVFEFDSGPKVIDENLTKEELLEIVRYCLYKRNDRDRFVEKLLTQPLW